MGSGTLRTLFSRFMETIKQPGYVEDDDYDSHHQDHVEIENGRVRSTSLEAVRRSRDAEIGIGVAATIRRHLNERHF